jgi:hypothetical protein
VAVLPMRCPAWPPTDVMTQGSTAQGTPRDRGTTPRCPSHTCRMASSHQGRVPAVTPPSLARTLPDRGSRDLARVRHRRPPTVSAACKKSVAAPPCQRSGQATPGASRAHQCGPESGSSRRRRPVECCGQAPPTPLALACDGSAIRHGRSRGVGHPSRCSLLTVQSRVRAMGPSALLSRWCRGVRPAS